MKSARALTHPDEVCPLCFSMPGDGETPGCPGCDVRPSAPCGICGAAAHWSPVLRTFVHVETEEESCEATATATLRRLLLSGATPTKVDTFHDEVHLEFATGERFSLGLLAFGGLK